MIEAYLAQNVYRQRQVGVDAYGAPTFGSTLQSMGRWLEKRRLVRNAQGEQVLSEITVTLPAEVELTPGDRLSDDARIFRQVIAVSTSRDLGGAAVLVRAYL